MNLPRGLTLKRSAQYTPVTAIAPIEGTNLVLSGSATQIELSSLNYDLDQSAVSPQRWKVFERERIHRIAIDQRRSSKVRRTVILGGKEAVLVELVLQDLNE